MVLASIEIKLKAVSINFKIELKLKGTELSGSTENDYISNAPGHLVLEEQLQHLHVLVVDGHEQRGPAQPIRDQYCDILTNHSSPAQRVDAVDVDAAAGTFQHSVKNILAVEKIF